MYLKRKCVRKHLGPILAEFCAAWVITSRKALISFSIYCMNYIIFILFTSYYNVIFLYSDILKIKNCLNDKISF